MFTRKALCLLIIPLVIEQILAVTIGMADTVMVARVGEAAVSGISLVDTINILLINIFSALATGGAVVSSQYLGRQENKNACIAAKQLLWAILILSSVIMALALILRNALLGLIFGHIEADVMSHAQTYFWLSAISYPFLAIYNSCAALFRTMGNSKISMLTSLLMNVINISGNAILIFGFNMGVAGAGIASLTSRAIGAVIMVILLRNGTNPIHVRDPWKPQFNFSMIKNILKIGIPNGMENGMFQIGKILVQGLIASFGTAAIAANAVANNLASIQILPGAAIGLAMITVVGQCVGAQDYKQAKMYAIKLMKITYISMFALDIFLLAIASPLIGFYHLSPEASATAWELIVCHTVCAVVFWPSSFTLPNALRAAGDVKFTMLTSIVSMWIFRIGLSYVLGAWLQLGVLGVWIAMTVDWVFRAALFIQRFLREKWKHRQVI